MENSKEKIGTEEVRAKEEVAEKVAETQVETTDGKLVTVTEVDVKEVVSAEVESKTKTGETVAAAEEVIETKEEVVTTSDGTTVEEAAEKVAIDQAVVAEGVSKGPEDASAKTEEVAASAVPESAPKKLEEGALPTSNTKVGESSGVADSVPEANLATKGSGGNQETSEIPKSTENQQPVSATPRTHTSWTNCCGLLDLLKGSHQ